MPGFESGVTAYQLGAWGRVTSTLSSFISSSVKRSEIISVLNRFAEYLDPPGFLPFFVHKVSSPFSADCTEAPPVRAPLSVM